MSELTTQCGHSLVTCHTDRCFLVTPKRRQQLKDALKAISAMTRQELELERELALVRRDRAALDADLARRIKSMEDAGLTPSQWRSLIHGLEPEISAVCSRHALAGL